ncbi:hypothetical protein FRC12_017856 [Ceratobasidium sp. 428]|nr:hypothetical protein FRC09_006083 [Ceratobasidium sp. 395]KAG8785195.1 hypothetical protein FRC12_017856 [Ceratobasidium sp. 428]
MSQASFHDVSILSRGPEERSEAEERWVTFQPYLLSKGYRLRARYQPDWVPSWTIAGGRPDNCEDSRDSMPVRVLDAVRIDDERQVMIKMLVPSVDDREGEDELDLLQRFSASSLQVDPYNHVVPCLDAFPIPGVQNGIFVVMPLLSRYDYPPFSNLEELHDFLWQIFEGLLFLHDNNVAHCDIASANIMMDARPLFNEPFHPFLRHLTMDGKRLIYPRYLRSQRSVRYYYIDLGYAKRFHDPDTPRLLVGTRARERAPEQKGGQPYDPFVADVYQLGAVLRRDLIPKYVTLQFLLPLARLMTERDPSQRPALKVARDRMSAEFDELSGWTRRWPIIPQDVRFTNRCILVFAAITNELILSMKYSLAALMFWRR